MSEQYRNKSVIIDAEIYRPGLEDGFSCIPFVSTCEWKDEDGNYKQCEKCKLDIRKKPFISILGRKQYIDRGDYIIIGITGKKYPCKPDRFNNIYEVVEIGLSKKIERNKHASMEGRICCICGSDKTYEYKGDPKWYKKYDEDGLWDGKSYKCMKCYNVGYIR